MTMTPIQIVIMALALAAGIATMRFAPFLLFPENKKVPKIIQYLGKVLPPAIIALLVVFCLRNVEFIHGQTHGIPEILAILCVCGLHTWKRNSLLSIGGGTAFYMILLHVLSNYT